jgi:YfiH family protein
MPDDRSPPIHFWAPARALGVSVAITTRHGGVSTANYASLNLGLHVGDDPERVLVNRERAAAAFGRPLDTFVFAEQVHGTTVTTVGRTDQGSGISRMADAVPSTDILVTGSVGTTLVMLVADCVPMAVVDPDARVLAAVHAGWRGTAAGAVAAAVEALAQAGGRPERMTAFMGPAVHPSRYQVTAEVTEGLTRASAPEPLAPGVARPDGPDHWRVDLIAANRDQLVRAGLAPVRVFDSGTTTADPDCFSDRAARPCGRFGLLARLLP